VGAEVVEGVEDLAELIGLVTLEALRRDRVQAFEDPAVEERVFVRSAFIRLESVEVS
jgi:hypothetical protein